MKIYRPVSFIMVLLDKNSNGAQALAQMFEVTQRTIYRDVETINMAGIPIRSTPGVDGGFEIMEEYKLEKKVFSSSDLSAILMGLLIGTELSFRDFCGFRLKTDRNCHFGIFAVLG